MKKFVFFFLAAIILSCESKNLKSFEEKIKESRGENGNKIWAVLVAGSNGYYNYRHQSDVLHAYKLLNKNHGIPKEQIVLMMYDDIAHSSENPFQGNIINVPGGENLYTDDIVKDYTGKDVTPENFMKVLLGDEELKKSGKKVLESNENDHVFVFFSDHGGPGLIAFPNKYLYADDLIKTLKDMKSKNMFKKLVFYLEACESGSMFDKLLDENLDIYAVTAANPTESSYATFLDEKRNTYLADEFSVNWMLDSEKYDKEKKDELLNEQFENVKKNTIKSHVCRYGDLKISSEYHVNDFIGKPISSSNSLDIKYMMDSDHERIDSREAEYYLTKLNSQKHNDNKFEILQKNRNMTLNFINQLTSKLSQTLNVGNYNLTKKSQIENTECYKQFVDLFNDHCANITKHTYLLRHLHIFVNTCNIIQHNEQQNIVSVDSLELKKQVKNYCKLYKKSFSKISNVV